MPAAAGANAARHKYMDGSGKHHKGGHGGDQRITAADLLRPPRRHRDESEEEEEEQAPPEKSDTPQVSCSLLQRAINFIYDKRKIKRRPVTPWMVEGSFHPDNLVGSITAPKKRIREGIMHKLGIGDL